MKLFCWICDNPFKSALVTWALCFAGASFFVAIPLAGVSLLLSSQAFLTHARDTSRHE